jgi:hypothetical protein
MYVPVCKHKVMESQELEDPCSIHILVPDLLEPMYEYQRTKLTKAKEQNKTEQNSCFFYHVQ